jgi:glycine/D-amino acid oxidase-like deaminating enzyme
MPARASDVVVVGSGIVGAAIAYHAARLGAAVTLADRALPASGVTAASFGWIGAPGELRGPGAALRRAATADYRRLERELPGVRVRWTGSLSLASPAVLGSGQERLGAAEIAALEPNLRDPPAEAVYAAGDGAVDPVAVTEALVQGAREHGARVLAGTSAGPVRAGPGRVAGVETAAGWVPASTVVLATGADTPLLCARLGVTLSVAASPAVLVRCPAPPGVVRTLVAGPELEVRDAGDGTLVAAVDHRGEATREDLARTARRTLDRIVSAFRGTSELRAAGAQVGWRPMPVDGEPVLGPVDGVDGLYLAVMHSAVTLAPAVGRLAAEEIVRGADAPELAGCRPARVVTVDR